MRQAVILAATCAFVPLFAIQIARADDMQDASKLLRAGQHQQALEHVNRVLSAKPKDPQARFVKGLILTEQGNAREAIEIFQRLTKDYPELPEPYNNLAVIYAAQGQYDRARASLEQSIRTHPSYATAYENLGDVYAKLASQAYDKALQLDSTNSGAQNKLALVRDLVGGPKSAAAASTPSAKPAAVVAAVTPKPQAAKPTPVSSPTASAQTKPTVAKPAGEAKPEPKPAPITAAKPPADPSKIIVDTVIDWAKAWSSNDVDKYLSFYAVDFKTPRNMKREDWVKQRHARIAPPRKISVTVATPTVSLDGDNLATVRFRQTYRSHPLNSTQTKTLVFVKAGEQWLILQERVGN